MGSCGAVYEGLSRKIENRDKIETKIRDDREIAPPRIRGPGPRPAPLQTKPWSRRRAGLRDDVSRPHLPTATPARVGLSSAPPRATAPRARTERPASPRPLRPGRVGARAALESPQLGAPRGVQGHEEVEEPGRFVAVDAATGASNQVHIIRAVRGEQMTTAEMCVAAHPRDLVDTTGEIFSST